LDRVPDHAAINETVKLVKKNGAAYGAGLCNAVLRRVSENGLKLPELPQTPDGDARSLTGEQARYYSVKYSVPEALLTLWTEAYGLEKTEGILADALGPRPLTVRVNPTKTTADALVARLQEEGVSAAPHGKVENALVLQEPGSLSELPSFREGLFHVQDAASQLCCQNLDARPGQVVFDLCAAPGGKSCTLAEHMGDSGVVKAFDLHEHRVELIRENASRLGLSCVETAVGDATVYDPENGLADRVLADVPCAGYGDIGRKPEIRFRDPAFVDDLPPLQYNILNNAERYLKPGGRLVYSTCSLNPAENEAVVERFLSAHPDCTLLYQKTCFPHEYQCDGFFNAVIEKAGRLERTQRHPVHDAAGADRRPGRSGSAKVSRLPGIRLAPQKVCGGLRRHDEPLQRPAGNAGGAVRHL
ncbi:MAG: 16S rRNA (cytosine(967)-C(5))-methyltransferase RsmB, partial [Clostridia bacterium]|nr:16S rRNA (cytosine(967)-C(5))-methyltransferase RsmB [Clostridia bacterium]